MTNQNEQATSEQVASSSNTEPPAQRPNMFSFKGRARRKEYWITTGIITIISIFIALAQIDAEFASQATRLATDPFAIVYLNIGILITIIVAYIAAWPVTVRRLHDRNCSGWWILLFSILGVIPVVGWFSNLAYMILLYFLDGTPYTNKYGPDPKGRNYNCSK